MPLNQEQLKEIARSKLSEICASGDELERYSAVLDVEEKNFTNQGFWDTIAAFIESGKKSENPNNLLYAYLCGVADEDPLVLRTWREDENGDTAADGIVIRLVDATECLLHKWMRLELKNGHTAAAQNIKTGDEIKLSDGSYATVASRSKIRNKKWSVSKAASYICDRSAFVVFPGWKMHNAWQSNDVPDIDVDFSPWVRDKLKLALREMYGEDKVVSIANYLTFKLRSAIKDVARVFEVPYKEVNDLTVQLDALANYGSDSGDDEMDDDAMWEIAVSTVPALGTFSRAYPQVIDIAKRLIGRRCRLSMHASGVVVSKETVSRTVPLVFRVKDKTKHILAAYSEGQSRSDLKTFGHAKLDILGLETLNDIRGAMDLIYERYGVLPTDNGSMLVIWKRIPAISNKTNELEYFNGDQIEPGFIYCHELGDGKIEYFKVTDRCRKFGGLYRLAPDFPDWSDEAYLDEESALQLAAEGATLSVFQFDSYLAQKTTKGLGPTSFEDMAAITTIIRPGALGIGADEHYIERKHGKDKWEEYTPAAIADLTRETYGLPIYQEQIMLLLNRIGRIPLPECEKIRKAMSQKKEAVFATYKEKFIEGAIETCNWTREEAETYWGATKPQLTGLMAWSAYGFNRCIAYDSVVQDEQHNAILAKDCVPGTRIEAYDPATGNMFYDEVVDVHENGIRHVYEIEFENGYTITCTRDHEFVCEDGKKHRLEDIILVSDETHKVRIMVKDKQQFTPCGIIIARPNGEKNVLDLEMKSGTHNYIANGVVVGNSHAVAYTVLSMRCLYLKRHFTPEWYASVLSNFEAGNVKIRDYSAEAMRIFGLEFRPVHINKSGSRWRIADDEQDAPLYMPLSQIKKVGSAAEEIEKKAPFTSFEDFLHRAKVKRDAIENLIKVGAFDCFCEDRSGLLSYFDKFYAVKSKLGVTSTEVKRWMSSLLEKRELSAAIKAFGVFKDYIESKGAIIGCRISCELFVMWTKKQLHLMPQDWFIDFADEEFARSMFIDEPTLAVQSDNFVKGIAESMGIASLQDTLLSEEHKSWTDEEKMAAQEEAYGFIPPFAHPILEYVDKRSRRTISDARLTRGGPVDCMIKTVKKMKAKSSDTIYYRIMIDDGLECLGVTVWEKQMKNNAGILMPGSFVRINISDIDARYRSATLIDTPYSELRTLIKVKHIEAQKKRAVIDRERAWKSTLEQLG